MNSSDMKCFKWSDGIEVTISDRGSYPRLCKLHDGRLMCAYDGMFVKYSTDDGLTWSMPTAASRFPEYKGLICANPALWQLADGTIFLAYRANGRRQETNEQYTSIQVSASDDGGETWYHHSTVYEHIGAGGVYEPHFELLDGILTVFYANDTEKVGVLPYQYIEYKQWIGSEWTNRTVVCDGKKHKSRDGMPVWCRLTDGTYVCVIEAWNTSGNGNMMIQLVTSADGKTWSEPRDIYIAKKGKAGAPYVAELPSGQLIVSFQTDEDMTREGDIYSAMKTIVSNGKRAEELAPEDFSEPDMPFETPDGYCSIWNGLYVNGDFLYAVTGTNYPSPRVALKRCKLSTEK